MSSRHPKGRAKRQDKLGHLPDPPPLEPGGLPTGYYKGRVPDNVMKKHARLFNLGPLLMKPKRDHFVAMIRSFHVMDRRPTPYKFSIHKAQTERYYRELDQIRQMRLEEEDNELEELALANARSDDPDQLKWARMREENSRPCIAYMQGISPEGHPVSVEVREFKPYFFVKLARSWTEHQVELFVAGLERKCVLKRDTLTASLVPRKDLFLFHPDPKEPWKPRKWKYVAIFFPNMAVHNRASGKMKYPLCIRGVPQSEEVLHPEEVFRSDMEHAQRIIDQADVKPEGWIIIHKSKWRFASKDRRITTCPYEIFTTLKAIKPLQDDMNHPLVPSVDTIAPVLLDSWDIECVRGADDGELPDPEVGADVCFMVCHSFAWLGSVPPYWAKTRPDVQVGQVFLRVGQVIGKTKPVEGMIVEEVSTEIQIVQRMRDWFAVIMDVDVLSAFNGDRFDVPFMYKKAHRFGNACGRFFYMSRILDHKVEAKTKGLKSGALGDNELFLINPVGRHTFDTFQYIKSNAKLDLYSLNHIAKTYLGKSKHDVNFRDIFAAYKSTPDDLHKVLAYCGQDCDLPVEIIDRRMLFINLVEMARVTLTQSYILLTSGQQVKVLNQLMHYAHADAFVINMLYSTDYATTEKYGGGTVLPPIAGYHTAPTTVLDFASLYPSIMMAWNLCYSTLVSDEMFEWITTRHPEYFEMGLKINEFPTAGGVHRFVDNNLGILPKVLKTLGSERGKAKKLMANAPNSTVRGIMNGRQLSLKVSMNSIYGFTGVKQGKLPCRPIAETTTSLGGKMIIHCKDCMEKWYPGTKVIYGDSVAPWCPVLTRRRALDGSRGWLVEHQPIEALASTWLLRRDGKQYGVGMPETHVWSDKGWTKIRQVIRHTYEGDLFRVQTGRSVVTVTRDHSLVDERGKEVKPTEVGEANLLHRPLPSDLTDLFLCPDATPEDLCIDELNDQNRTVAWCQAAKAYYSKTIFLGRDDDQGISRCSGQRSVVKMTLLPYRGYVYDLTTANHHFQAGIGDMIVHNTDSVMVQFPKSLCPTTVDAFKLGFEAGDRLTAEFKPPIEMEMEKIYQPYLLKKRKYYAGKIYESIDQVRKYIYGEEVEGKVKEPYVDIKGIKPARRDNCAMMRELCLGILDRLFSTGDLDTHLDTCVAMVEETLEKLSRGEIPVEKLTITGGMRSSYDITIPPHAAVGRRFNYNPGDRVPFVICDVPEMDRVVSKKDKKANKRKRGSSAGGLEAIHVGDLVKANRAKASASTPLAAYARHPDEITSGKYKPDVAYYVEKQLAKALEIVFVDRWDEVQAMLKTTIRDAKGEQQGLQKIGDFMTVMTPKPRKPKDASRPKEPAQVDSLSESQPASPARPKSRRRIIPPRRPKMSKKEKEDHLKKGMQKIGDFM
jgi:DNA polymerase elongation subunit (family B)